MHVLFPNFIHQPLDLVAARDRDLDVKGIRSIWESFPNIGRDLWSLVCVHVVSLLHDVKLGYEKLVSIPACSFCVGLVSDKSESILQHSVIVVAWERKLERVDLGTEGVDRAFRSVFSIVEDARYGIEPTASSGVEWEAWLRNYLPALFLIHLDMGCFHQITFETCVV